jgi:putative salt-induced outer membrane protein YdiY
MKRRRFPTRRHGAPLAALAALSAVTALSASVPARAEDPVPDGQWRGSGGGGLAVASGNTRSTTLNANFSAAAITDSDKLSYYGQALYGRAKINNVTSTSANLERLGGRYDRNLTYEIYAFGGLDFEHDQITLIDLRSVLSTGLGLHVVRSDHNTWDVFGGLTYKYDHYLQPGVVISDSRRIYYTAPEFTVGEESNHKLSDTTTFKQKLEAYEDLRSTGAYRATFDAALAVAMSKTLQLTVSLQDRYSSIAVAPVLKNDVLLTAGVAYKFGPQ